MIQPIQPRCEPGFAKDVYQKMDAAVLAVSWRMEGFIFGFEPFRLASGLLHRQDGWLKAD